MMDGLTRDAQKVAAAGYAVYLKKRKIGASKSNAKRIDMNDVLGVYIKDMTPQDYRDTLSELKRALGIRPDLVYSYTLDDKFIVYMENRFKNGAKDVLSFLAQFIP